MQASIHIEVAVAAVVITLLRFARIGVAHGLQCRGGIVKNLRDSVAIDVLPDSNGGRLNHRAGDLPVGRPSGAVHDHKWQTARQTSNAGESPSSYELVDKDTMVG